MARAQKKQVPLSFEVVTARPKLSKEGIAADRMAALSALKAELKIRKPVPGDPPQKPPAEAFWAVQLPSGGSYRLAFYDGPVRAWARGIGLPAPAIKALLPSARTVGKPELGDLVPTPIQWPPAFSAKKAKVAGKYDTVPALFGSLSFRPDSAIKSMQVALTPSAGKVIVRTKSGRRLLPWAAVEWGPDKPPVWRWVRGSAPLLLKEPMALDRPTAGEGLLRGSWEAVIEYDADAGVVPVLVTLRRRVTAYATLFVQGPAAAQRVDGKASWRYGWEKGRGAEKWWVTASWDEEGRAASYQTAIQAGLAAFFRSVVGPSCTKRDTEYPPK